MRKGADFLFFVKAGQQNVLAHVYSGQITLQMAIRFPAFFAGFHMFDNRLLATITITMPRGTDVTKLTPVIATNGVKSLTPGTGETVDFTNAVTYTAAMEDGNSKTYTVTVYVDKGTLADQFWDKLTNFANQVSWWQYAEKQQSTSKYPKYW